MDGLELKLLLLLLLANGTPILAKRLLGDRWAFPLDAHRLFLDHRPVFGHTKTLRGLILGVASCTLAAPVLGLTWSSGLLIGMCALAGDLAGSFVKRRLGLASSSRATGLDQIPESLLPALVAMPLLGIGWRSVAVVVMGFVLIDVAASRVLHRLGIRDRPY